MRYTIWRVSEDGDAFPLGSTGSTTVKENALAKAHNLNQKLIASDSETTDRFVVRDDKSREVEATSKKMSLD